MHSVTNDEVSAARNYGGVWCSFLPDLSGITVFATPDEAYEHSLERSSWVIFLAFGVDIAELIDQILGARPQENHHP